MVVFMALLLSYWFGHVPPNIEGDMPPIIEEIFGLIKIGLMGYLPSRGLEKIATTFKIGNIIEKFVSKKLG